MCGGWLNLVVVGGSVWSPKFGKAWRARRKQFQQKVFFEWRQRRRLLMLTCWYAWFNQFVVLLLFLVTILFIAFKEYPKIGYPHICQSSKALKSTLKLIHADDVASNTLFLNYLELVHQNSKERSCFLRMLRSTYSKMIYYYKKL